jgi:GTP cyclohydrolase I
LNVVDDLDDNTFRTGVDQMTSAAIPIENSGGSSLRLLRQQSPGIDLQRIERAAREMILAIGEDPDRDGLRETPARVARAWRELFAGVRERADLHLRRVFSEPSEGLVAVRDIELFSMCEHHLLPFLGQAHIAYQPAGGRIVGLSKLARTVETFARRPQVQERLTAQIADALLEHLEPAGVLVIIEAQHMCMAMRGVSRSRSTTTTTAARGLFDEDPAARSEAMRILLGR